MVKGGKVIGQFRDFWPFRTNCTPRSKSLPEVKSIMLNGY
jgi:hypothetical protein